MEFLVSEVFVFINNLSFPRLVNCATAALNEERSCREKRSLQHSESWFAEILQKISPTCQDRKSHANCVLLFGHSCSRRSATRFLCFYEYLQVQTCLLLNPFT